MRIGIYTGASGIIGVLTGLVLSSWWKKRGNEKAEAHVCAIGMVRGAQKSDKSMVSETRD